MSQLTLALFVASAVRLTVPILLAAFGELVSERAGIFNVGIEGMMLFGAFSAVAGAGWTSSAPGGLAVGAAFGCLSGLVLGVFVVLLRADQVVAGIGLNILALGVTSFLRDQFLKSQLTPVTAGVLGPQRIPVLADIPVVGRGFFDQSPLVYAAGAIALALYAFLRYTSAGLVLRSVGEGATAADAAGVPVLRVRLLAIGFTGLLAGLGGGYLSLVAGGGVFVDNMTGGRGYLAIAIAIFGRWQPLWVVAAALFFGAADALQYQGQALGLTVPTPILLMSPFLLALVAWVALGKSKTAPADLGRPFIRARS
jgi:general nucleoside transport system permease protein